MFFFVILTFWFQFVFQVNYHPTGAINLDSNLLTYLDRELFQPIVTYFLTNGNAFEISAAKSKSFV